VFSIAFVGHGVPFIVWPNHSVSGKVYETVLKTESKRVGQRVRNGPSGIIGTCSSASDSVPLVELEGVRVRKKSYAESDCVCENVSNSAINIV